MKTTLKISNGTFSIGILLLCLTIACSKKKNPEPTTPTCHIVTAGGEGTIFNISYDAEGKITKITSGNMANTYQYDGNTVVVRTTNSGTFHSKKIYTLHSNGFVSNKRKENNETGTDWQNYEFVYSNGTQLIKTTVTTSSGDIPTIYTHEWDNGNMIPANSTTYEYYTDKANQPGDFGYFQGLFEHDGMKIYHSKNALKSVTIGSTHISITYTADQDGKITSMTVTQNGTSTETVNYQYQCN